MEGHTWVPTSRTVTGLASYEGCQTSVAMTKGMLGSIIIVLRNTVP